MSADSKRELIILQIKSELELLESISFVKRVRPALDDLANFASTQLPLIAMESGLPIPKVKKSSRISGKPDLFISDLEIKLFCYALENNDPDILISNLADDIWKKLYADPLHGNLCLETDVKPQMEVAIWAPYIAFHFLLTLTYVHTKEGI